MTQDSPPPRPGPNRDSAAPRRTQRSTQAYEAIMDATVAVLQEVGYQRLTIEGVAARAGVGKTTIYRWWPTKPSLVIAAVDRHLDLPPVQPTGDSRSDVRALIQRVVDTFTTSPLGKVLPALALDLAQDPEATAQLLAMLGPRRAANAAILYSAAGRGDLPHDLDAHLLLDIVAGVMLYRSIMGQPTSAVVDQLTDLVLDTRLPRVHT